MRIILYWLYWNCIYYVFRWNYVSTWSFTFWRGLVNSRTCHIYNRKRCLTESYNAVVWNCITYNSWRIGFLFVWFLACIIFGHFASRCNSDFFLFFKKSVLWFKQIIIHIYIVIYNYTFYNIIMMGFRKKNRFEENGAQFGVISGESKKQYELYSNQITFLL